MATKKGARYLSFVTPLWGVTVHVVEGPTLAEAAKEARRRWPELDLSTKDVERADGFCRTNDAEEPIILLPVGASAGCVAHECLHAAHFVLVKVGFDVSATNDEATAYTLQEIVDAVAPWLTSRRRVHSQPAAPVAKTAVQAPAKQAVEGEGHASQA